MHTTFRHFLFSLLFSLLTVVVSGEILLSNIPSIQQTEWYACYQNVQPTFSSVFVYHKGLIKHSKTVCPFIHFSFNALVFLKIEKHFPSKIYQYQVAPRLIRQFFRLKTGSTTSEDDDLNLI